MDSTSTGTPAKAPDLSSLTPLIAALVTAFGAWKLFEPKLERMRAIRNEAGRLEPGFRMLYQIPQYVLIVISTGIVVFLALAFIDSFQPGLLPSYFPKRAVQTALASENIVWIVFSVGGLGAVIYWNLATRLLMSIFWLLSALPIPGLRNRFGAGGESVGWHQTAAVCEGPDKGSPLMVDYAAIDRVAHQILARLANEAGAQDYAAEPTNLSKAEKANLALFGCIMEANYYAQRWTAPSWSSFYSGLADIQRSNPLFAPRELLAFGNAQFFFEAFRDRLDAALTARQQPCPPDRGLAAAGDIGRTWELLTREAKGNVLRLSPFIAPIFGGRTAWLDYRLREVPKLNTDGMRPQLIKLLTRWKTLPIGRGVFVQPFSKRLAWLLFQEGVLRALPELKEVTFNGTGQVPITRIAALRVVRKVAALIECGASAEALAVARRLGPVIWTRLERADFMLWSWAREALDEAQKNAWDKTKWRWKFEDGRLQRQS